MSWSRVEILTTVIVVLAMGVLGLLVYKLVDAINDGNVHNKEQVEASSDLPQEEEEDELDTWLPEDSLAYLDEMSALEDSDDLAAAGGGIAEEEIATAKQEKTWPADRPTTASVPSASRSAADRGVPVSSSTPTTERKPVTAAPAETRASVNPRPAPAVIGSRTNTEGIYQVIAGAFKSQVNAESLVGQLRRLGYTQTSVLSADNGIYRVMVQSFDNSAAATNLKRELASKGFRDCYVKAN